MKTCAYCGGKGPFTREHILPKYLYKRTPEYQMQYLRAAPDKLVGGEPTIRDVCARCNNGVLSELDAYACQLYDRYFKDFVNANDSIRFHYDFDRLARWLLKVAYNSARAHESDDGTFSACARYVLEGAPRPKGLTLLVQLVIPHKVQEDKRHLLPPEMKDAQELFPERHRISRVARFSEHDPRLSAARMISIESYHFFIFAAPDTKIPRQLWRKGMRAIKKSKSFRGSWQLRPSCSEMVLRASPVDVLSTVEFHFLENLQLYWQAFMREEAAI